MPSPFLSAIRDDLSHYPAQAIVNDALAALLAVVAIGAWALLLVGVVA